MLSGREINWIQDLVYDKVPKSEIGEMTEEQEKEYDSTWAESVEHEKKYGEWPAFEPVELDWDEIPDIYNSSAEDWVEERKEKRQEAQDKK